MNSNSISSLPPILKVKNPTFWAPLIKGESRFTHEGSVRILVKGLN